MAKVISADNCGLVWDIPMYSPMSRIKYRVAVAADSEVDAVSHALAEFPYLAVDQNPDEYDYVRVDITQCDEVHTQFVRSN